MKHNIAKIIGLHVLTQRKLLGLDQKDLAAKVGITPAALCLIEQGKRNPSLSTLGLLATALGVTPSALLAPD